MTISVKERGAALILVLMVVAIITSVGVFSSNNLINLSKFSNDLKNRQQAQWYAVGVESTASNFLEQRVREKNRSKIIADNDLPVIKVTLEGAQIEGSLKDLNACFNVNSLIRKDEISGDSIINQGGVDHYKRLLKVLSFNDFEIGGLIYPLVDWLDSDVFYSDSLGAEDDYYIRKDPSYRTGNQPISVLLELNSIKNYSMEVVKNLSPYLCSLPLIGNTSVNINAIPEDKPALLAMFFGENFSLTSAKNILRDRPEGGFLDIAEFWAHPELEDVIVSKSVRSQLRVNSYFYLLKTKVLAQGYPYYMESVMSLEDSGFVSILSRNIGVYDG
ncbi:MAG: type II secretion system minor pseudopilin GspK [SAR86 cluster bacterium]|nr:type II secretion system minor pseudopilin GspK [SAR86 cluster bacterium]